MPPELRRTLRLRYLMAEIDKDVARAFLCKKQGDEHDIDALTAWDIASFNLQQCREEWLDACT